MALQRYWDTLEAWVRNRRIGRKKYVRVNVISGLVGFAVIFVPLLLLVFLPDFHSDFLTIPFTAISICAAIVMILVYIASSIARLRDLGFASNWFILGLVPYVNIAFFLVLALREGKVARSRAGRRPKRSEGTSQEADAAPAERTDTAIEARTDGVAEPEASASSETAPRTVE